MDHDMRHRQLFLVLRGDTGLHKVIATAVTARRKPRVTRLIDGAPARGDGPSVRYPKPRSAGIFRGLTDRGDERELFAGGR